MDQESDHHGDIKRKETASHADIEANAYALEHPTQTNDSSLKEPQLRPQTMDTASAFARSALGPPETPLTRPRIKVTHKIGLQEKIRDMEDLLTEVPTLQDTAQESEHIERIIKLILEVQTVFMDMETRHRDDIEKAELNTYKSSLNNIVFNTKGWQSRNRKDKELQETSRTQQCTIAPTEKHHNVVNEENQPGFKEDTDSGILLNPNQSIIKEKLRSKVYTSKALLKMMTTPTQEVCSAPVLSQMPMHVGYIERMRDLAYGVAIDFINIDPNHKDHINDTEAEQEGDIETKQKGP